VTPTTEFAKRRNAVMVEAQIVLADMVLRDPVAVNTNTPAKTNR
jgi:hypothetical protein